MPRARKRALSAYERRIESYLRRHPGASRQEARGHRRSVAESEYQRRIRRYRERHPGASRAEAAGHRSSRDLERALRTVRLPAYVSFLGVDRQADGTWGRVSFVLGNDEGEREFVLGPDRFYRLRAIGELISDRGITLLGGKYLQMMIEWTEA